MTDPIIPKYGSSTLVDVLPSIASKLGVSTTPAAISLPDASHYVLVMVDGLGFNILERHLEYAPFMAHFFEESHRLTSGVPSTTATSLTCLGTGLTPGVHGMVGYSFRDPSGQVMNALTFDTGADPFEIQPNQTQFEKLTAGGVAVSNVSPARFENSGLTLAGQRGTNFIPIEDEHDFLGRIEATCESVKRGDRTFTYVYERDLDHIGHSCGVADDSWRLTLARIDQFISDLATALGPSVCLLITGDHGMLDVDPGHRLIVQEEPKLCSGLTAVAGEGRLRQLYTDEPEAVAKRWAQFLGERAWVKTRQEATEAGWFGDVANSVKTRIGDVLVAMRTDWAIMTTEAPGEFSLVGMHGSLTEDEMYVPLMFTTPEVN